MFIVRALDCRTAFSMCIPESNLNAKFLRIEARTVADSIVNVVFVNALILCMLVGRAVRRRRLVCYSYILRTACVMNELFYFSLIPPQYDRTDFLVSKVPSYFNETNERTFHVLLYLYLTNI